jgi:hypothetical protein
MEDACLDGSDLFEDGVCGERFSHDLLVSLDQLAPRPVPAPEQHYP